MWLFRYNLPWAMLQRTDNRNQLRKSALVLSYWRGGQKPLTAGLRMGLRRGGLALLLAVYHWLRSLWELFRLHLGNNTTDRSVN